MEAPQQFAAVQNPLLIAKARKAAVKQAFIGQLDNLP